VADEDDRDVPAVLFAELLQAPPDVLVGVGGLAVPAGEPVADERCGDASLRGRGVHELLERPQARHGERALARGLQAGDRAAVTEQGDGAGLAHRGALL
jgi:hypothetical protein